MARVKRWATGLVLLAGLAGCSAGRWGGAAHDANDALGWPVEGRLSSTFGRRGFKFHDGIDISAPLGTAVRAARGGVVIFSGRRPGYGNVVVIRHQRGFWTLYGHNLRNLVRHGERVELGDPIATLGMTGNAEAPHVHFEVRRDEEPVDPLAYLQSSPRGGRFVRSETNLLTSIGGNGRE